MKEFDELINDLKCLVYVWEDNKKDSFRDTIESLAYAWCADDLVKIIEKYENQKDIE